MNSLIDRIVALEALNTPEAAAKLREIELAVTAVLHREPNAPIIGLVEYYLRSGNYSSWNPDIPSTVFKNLSTMPDITEAVVIPFAKGSGNADIERELRNLNLRGANAIETLAYGAQFCCDEGSNPWIRGYGEKIACKEWKSNPLLPDKYFETELVIRVCDALLPIGKKRGWRASLYETMVYTATTSTVFSVLALPAK